MYSQYRNSNYVPEYILRRRISKYPDPTHEELEILTQEYLNAGGHITHLRYCKEMADQHSREDLQGFFNSDVDESVARFADSF